MAKAMSQESLFDSIGPAYEAAFAACTPQKVSLDWLLTQLPAQASVLDIGCGTGRPVCSTLSAAGHHVLGIDVSGVMIEASKRNVPSAEFQKVDFKDFAPHKGKKYDAITAYFSMLVNITQDEIRAQIANIHGWLRDGGLFIFATVPFSGENKKTAWMGRPIVAGSLSPDELLQSIQRVGFKVLEVESSKFMPTAVEAGICKEGECDEEDHLFVYARK